MTDLRHGVTAAAHEALDLLDEHREAFARQDLSTAILNMDLNLDDVTVETTAAARRGALAMLAARAIAAAETLEAVPPRRSDQPGD